jgi:hypothetical protein
MKAFWHPQLFELLQAVPMQIYPIGAVCQQDNRAFKSTLIALHFKMKFEAFIRLNGTRCHCHSIYLDF